LWSCTTVESVAKACAQIGDRVISQKYYPRAAHSPDPVISFYGSNAKDSAYADKLKIIQELKSTLLLQDLSNQSQQMCKNVMKILS